MNLRGIMSLNNHVKSEYFATSHFGKIKCVNRVEKILKSTPRNHERRH